MGQTADLGIVIAFIGVLSGVGVLAGAFAGAYFFGKSRAQKETLRGGSDPELLARVSRPGCCRSERRSSPRIVGAS
jgi:hypothetical protein